MKIGKMSLDNCKEALKWRDEYRHTLRTTHFITDEMQKDFYSNVICNPNSPHRYYGVFEDIINKFRNSVMQDKFIGMAGLTNISWENSNAEISLIIDPLCHKNGYGKKAVELILSEAFGRLGLKTVYGEVYMCNDAVKFWEKITYEHGGYKTTLPNRKYWNGHYCDSVYFSIGVEE